MGYPITQDNDTLKKVTLSKTSLNTTINQKVHINYSLDNSALISLKIIGPEGELIRILSDKILKEKGDHSETWDGKDDEGKNVPDEVYTYILEATDLNGNTVSIPELPFSHNWDVFDIHRSSYDEEKNILQYKLPFPCRVRIRIGTANGPMLNTLVDWEPRLKGDIIEHWNGFDHDNVINLWEQKDLRIIISAFALPLQNIVTYGNKKIEYVQYRQLKGNKIKTTNQEEWKNRPRTTSKAMSEILSPDIEVTFPRLESQGETDNNIIPNLKQKVIVNVSLNKENRKYISNTKYEIIFFVDGVFYAEEPIGTNPFNWLWTTKGIKPGKHMLSVNLVTFRDQIGTKNMMINIVE